MPFSVELGELNGTAASMCPLRSKQLQQAWSVTGSDSSKREMAGALGDFASRRVSLWDLRDQLFKAESLGTEH